MPISRTPFASEEEDLLPFADESQGFAASFSPELELEPPYASEDSETAHASSLRSSAVSLAHQELQHWNPGGVKKKENDRSMKPALKSYWLTVTTEQEAEARIAAGDAWSSAFISTVIKRAGAGNAFRYSGAHREYVGGGKRARAAGDPAKYWSYRITEAAPEVGDIVVIERTGKGFPCGSTTYDNVDDGRLRPTHGDIVVAVRPGAIDVIGGNVSDSVSQKSLALDARGFVQQNTGGCQFIGLLKPPGHDRPGAVATTAVPTTAAPTANDQFVSVPTAVALASGERDENRLTNLTFASRHPELPLGYVIRREDTQLAHEWTRIRDSAIRPMMRSLQTR